MITEKTNKRWLRRLSAVEIIKELKHDPDASKELRRRERKIKKKRSV